MIFKIIRFTKRYALLLGVTVVTILLAANRQIVANILGQIVDIALNSGMGNSLLKVIYLLLGVLLMTFFSWLNNFLIGRYKNASMYVIRSKTIKVIEELPLPTLSKYSSGDLVSRMNNDLNFIEKLYGTVIPDTALKILTGAFAAAYGFYLNWKITLIIVVLSLVASVVTYIASKPLENKQSELQKINSETSSVFQDALNGYTEIKTFGAYESFKEGFNKLVKARVNKTFEISRRECLIGAFEISTSIAIQIGTIFLGLIFILRKEMTIGELVIFQQIQEVIRRIFSINYVSFIKSKAILTRLFVLWEEGKEIIEGPVKSGEEVAPIISFNRVSFSYETGIDNLLNDISFKISKNEAIALVGASGCGKSTVTKLICGFLNPTSGELLFKGHNYDLWNKQILRDDISLVEQNTYLFPGTIYDNIACGLYGREEGAVNENILKEEVEKAARDAALTEFISTLDKGYSTDVGEWGARLSGGQRQRIGIARAFVKKSELLILDEPTSALDAVTELEVQQSIEKLMNGRTTLIIAHRLSTIKNVDRILVLKDGKIIEEGKHEELLKNKGFYYKLYKQQINTEEELMSYD